MTRDYSIAHVWKGCVRHVIVYLESGYAIHITPDDGIQITSLQEATKGRKVEWSTRTGPSMSDQEIVQNAITLSRYKKYSVTSYNCEHFKEQLLGHRPTSTTVEKVVIGTAVVALGALLIRR